MKIKENDIEFFPESMIDNVGRVFIYKGEIYRGISDQYRSQTEEMIRSGFVDEMVSMHFFPETVISDLQTEEYEMVLRHKRIDDCSYYFEWTFDMIRDVGIFLLDFEKFLLERGYSLKDAHPYNIKFDGLKPIFVDFGSIVKSNCIEECFLNEFIAYYEQVLELMQKEPTMTRDRLVSRHALGIRYNLYCMMGINSKYEVDCLADRIRSDLRKISKGAQNDALAFIEVERNRFKDKESACASAWGNYQENEKTGDFDRFEKIIKYCSNKFENSTVLELGSNRGLFSKKLVREINVSRVICTDYDENAVNKLYLKLKEEKKS